MGFARKRAAHKPCFRGGCRARGTGDDGLSRSLVIAERRRERSPPLARGVTVVPVPTVPVPAVTVIVVDVPLPFT